mgnify:CR=1 FL=1
MFHPAWLAGLGPAWLAWGCLAWSLSGRLGRPVASSAHQEAARGPGRLLASLSAAAGHPAAPWGVRGPARSEGGVRVWARTFHPSERGAPEAWVRLALKNEIGGLCAADHRVERHPGPWFQLDLLRTLIGKLEHGASKEAPWTPRSRKSSSSALSFGGALPGLTDLARLADAEWLETQLAGGFDGFGAGGSFGGDECLPGVLGDGCIAPRFTAR